MRSTIEDQIKVNSLEIFQFYLKDFYPYGKVIPGKNISNPFKSEKQETPSFNIYKGYDGGYMFKDPATGDIGPVIKFVQRMENVDRNKALQIIKNQIL